MTLSSKQIVYLSICAILGLLFIVFISSEVINDGETLGAGNHGQIRVSQILDDASATSTGGWYRVGGARNIVFALDTTDNANMTVKFPCTIMDNLSASSPSTTAARSVDNQWDYVQVTDLEDGALIDGDTGVVLSGTDDHRMFQLNTDLVTFCTAEITTYVAGNATVQAISGDNL